MESIIKLAKSYLPGLVLCLPISIISWILGQKFHIVGGPVFAILIGMTVSLFFHGHPATKAGLTFCSKKVLQYAVILLGFGLNLSEIAIVGKSSLPIILSTILTSLIVSYLLFKLLKADAKTSILIGVGSSICGGSAIAATAPVIDANDEEIAQSISVIFLFNVLAALIFPSLGMLLGMSNQGFGLFAGTAVNDTSSVTAAASAWDGLHPGANTLNIATVVKLTRTLAIIPITLVLSLIYAKKHMSASKDKSFSIKKIFPMFILYFIGASVITTLATAIGLPGSMFSVFKTISKFFIVVAMSAIGLHTDIRKLIKSGYRPIIIGASCWVCITIVSIAMQKIFNIF